MDSTIPPDYRVPHNTPITSPSRTTQHVLFTPRGHGPWPSPLLSSFANSKTFIDTNTYQANASASPDAQPQCHSSYQQGLIHELRLINTNQTQLITGLKIRVAVLESDLKRAAKDKDDVLNSFLLTVSMLSPPSGTSAFQPAPRALPRGQIHHGTRAGDENDAIYEHNPPADAVINIDSTNDIKKLEEEIETLRKANKRLTRKFRISEVQELRLEQQLNQDANETPRGTGIDLPQENSDHAVLDTSAQSFLPSTVCKSTTLNDDSFVSNSPTVPNSPILLAAQISSFNPGDVGIESLDDILGDGDDLLDLRSTNNDKATSNHQLGQREVESEQGRHFDETVQGLQFSGKFREPRVLKTGFQLSGSFRGEDYTKPNGSVRLGMSDYDRFESGNQTLPLSSASSLKPVTRLWESSEEPTDALRTYQAAIDHRSQRQFVEFFRHGIAYIPKEDDENCYRTVCISNLPRGIELRDVVVRVRGGGIVGAVLMDTSSITGSMSVMVQFLHEVHATAYASYCSEIGISFPRGPGGDSDTSKGLEMVAADFALLSSPTYPLPVHRRRGIQEHGQTRCLSIRNFPQEFSIGALERDLACTNALRSASLLEIYFDDDRTLHLQFSSIDAAVSAFGLLMQRYMYRDLKVAFEKDPCDGALEQLLQNLGPRVPMFPRSSTKCAVEVRGATSCEVVSPQRKVLAALLNQRVRIPTFSGAGILSPSWADEVVEEAVADAHSEVSPPSSDGVVCDIVKENGGEALDSNEVGDAIQAIEVEDISEAEFQMGISMDKSLGESGAPVGLAGGRYAAPVPRFGENVGDYQPSKGRPLNRQATLGILLSEGDDEKSSQFGTFNPDQRRPERMELVAMPGLDLGKLVAPLDIDTTGHGTTAGNPDEISLLDDDEPEGSVRQEE